MSRRRRDAWRYRLFFAVGLILLAYTWLTLLPALWWSNISRNAAMELSVWFIAAQVWTVRATWRWLSPYWRRREQ